MFNFRQVSMERSDCTAAYEIDIAKGQKVKDFISYQVQHRSTEFGSIYFGPKFSPEWRSGKGFKYSNFQDVDIILREYGERIMKSPIKCDGGWGRMDYWIELEDIIDE